MDLPVYIIENNIQILKCVSIIKELLIFSLSNEDISSFSNTLIRVVNYTDEVDVLRNSLQLDDRNQLILVELTKVENKIISNTSLNLEDFLVLEKLLSCFFNCYNYSIAVWFEHLNSFYSDEPKTNSHKPVSNYTNDNELSELFKNTWMLRINIISIRTGKSHIILNDLISIFME